MDATAVCAARAIGARSRRELLILPALFGVFQSGMAAVGWLAGHFAGRYVAAWDHWVAFVLLVLVGGHMIVEAWRDEDGDEKPGGVMLYLGLALATSIDSAAAGITLPLVPVAPWLSLVIIGTVTMACCFVGYAAGRLLGRRVGPRLGILGGVVLIGIGIHILIRAA